MLFVQTTAPVGWTKSGAHDNKALRVTSGAVGSGGSVAFTSAFINHTIAISGGTDERTVTGVVGGTTLATSQIPLHGHPFMASYSNQNQAQTNTTGGFSTHNGGLSARPAYTGGPSTAQGTQIGGEGGSQPHDHPFGTFPHAHAFAGSTPLNIAVQYVDAIIATKD
jgi:microcystin-dependent protein